MLSTAPGPTLLGFDVIWLATILAAVATVAVMFAIYTAVTVRDPMLRRVKALNERPVSYTHLTLPTIYSV